MYLKKYPRNKILLRKEPSFIEFVHYIIGRSLPTNFILCIMEILVGISPGHYLTQMIKRGSYII
jgi:hypothetical protein